VRTGHNEGSIDRPGQSEALRRPMGPTCAAWGALFAGRRLATTLTRPHEHCSCTVQNRHAWRARVRHLAARCLSRVHAHTTARQREVQAAAHRACAAPCTLRRDGTPRLCRLGQPHDCSANGGCARACWKAARVHARWPRSNADQISRAERASEALRCGARGRRTDGACAHCRVETVVCAGWRRWFPRCQRRAVSAPSQFEHGVARTTAGGPPTEHGTGALSTPLPGHVARAIAHTHAHMRASQQPLPHGHDYAMEKLEVTRHRPCCGSCAVL
jgi:hypothetical protein